MTVMKKVYAKPSLKKQQALSSVTAGAASGAAARCKVGLA